MDAMADVKITNVKDGKSVPSIFTSFTLDKNLVVHGKSVQSPQILGYFSENVFTLLPGESRTVQFTPKLANNACKSDSELFCNFQNTYRLAKNLSESLYVRNYNDMLRFVDFQSSEAFI